MAFFIFTPRCYHYSLVVSCPLTACYLCPLIRACHRECLVWIWDSRTAHTGSGGDDALVPHSSFVVNLEELHHLKTYRTQCKFGLFG